MGIPDPYESNLSKATAKFLESVGNNIPYVVGFPCAAIVLGILIWCVYLGHQDYYDTQVEIEQHRAQTAEHAAAAGLVEQPYRTPNREAKTAWVKPEQYQPKIIDNWD